MSNADVSTWTDPEALAERLGISRTALDLHRASDVIDLHVDTFIWTRIFGYDPRLRHGLGPLRGAFFSQADLPRMRDGGLTGAMWSITTSPLRGEAKRAQVFARNLKVIQSLLGSVPHQVRIVTTTGEYAAAREAGAMAAFLAIQGGNALSEPGALSHLDDGSVLRVTVVHMSNSPLGDTSSPFRFGEDRGLGPRGREFIEELNRRRVLVDLAHIGKRGFAEACEVHDPSLPIVATHTGVDGVFPCWRNLDDGQLRRLADSGGLAGIVFHAAYLNGSQTGRARAADVAAHVAHVVNVVGEDHVAIGSDYDGMIIPPAQLRGVDRMPRLTQAMLDAGLSERAVHKALGQNFLRVLAQLRG